VGSYSTLRIIFDTPFIMYPGDKLIIKFPI